MLLYDFGDIIVRQGIMTQGKRIVQVSVAPGKLMGVYGCRWEGKRATHLCIDYSSFPSSPTLHFPPTRRRKRRRPPSCLANATSQVTTMPLSPRSF